ncbi:MAG: CsbD family protein [Polyangiales bacterium]
MSNEDRKGEGTMEKLGGKIKHAVGSLTGSEKLKAEGEAQYAKGEARREEAKGEERVKGSLQNVAGKIKNRVGALVGDKKTQAEGRAKEIEGEERISQNRPSTPSLL